MCLVNTFYRLLIIFLCCLKIKKLAFRLVFNIMTLRNLRRQQKKFCYQLKTLYSYIIHTHSHIVNNYSIISSMFLSMIFHASLNRTEGLISSTPLSTSTSISFKRNDIFILFPFRSKTYRFTAFSQNDDKFPYHIGSFV